jgi:hypothetical protein
MMDVTGADDDEEEKSRELAGDVIRNQKKENDDDDEEDETKASSCRKKRRIIEERRRRLLFGFSAVYTFLYVGSFFGWGPMQLMLEDNGSYSWKCTTTTTATTATTTSSSNSSQNENDTSTVCSEQTYALLRINLIATVTQISSPLLGQFVDAYGATSGFVFFSGSLWMGLILLTIASSSVRYSSSFPAADVVVALDRLLYVAFCFLAMATWMGGLLTVHTGLFFTGHARSRVIFTLNACFDAGAIFYLFLWWLSQSQVNANNDAASLTIVAAGFLFSAVIVTSASLYLWIVTVPQQQGPDEIETSTTAVDVLTPNALDVVDEAIDAVSEKSASMNSDMQLHEMTQASAAGAKGAEGSNSQQQQPSISWLSSEQQQQHQPPPQNINDTGTGSCYVLVAARTPRLQLQSTPYLLLCAYFAIHTTSNQWNLATQRDFLAYLGDNEQDNKYLTIFTLLMPASILALPLVDYAILHFGFVGAFQSINVLSFSYTVIKVSSSNLNVQILGFILFSFYRCFLFGVSISFLPTLIGPNVVGKAVGILYAVAGILSFVNIPLAKLAVERLDGNFFIPNLIYCLFAIPCIVLAFMIGRRIKQEDLAKSSMRDGDSEREPQSVK